MVPGDRWRSTALMAAAAGLVLEPLVGGPVFLAVVALSRPQRTSMVPGPALVTAAILLVVASLTATTATEWLLGIGLAAFVPLVSVWSARSRSGDAVAVTIGLALGITVHVGAALLVSPMLPARGLSPHANVLGALAALAAPSVVAVTLRASRTPSWWFATVVLTVATVATGSRAALLALLAGVTLVVAEWRLARPTAERAMRCSALCVTLAIVVSLSLVASWVWVRQPTLGDALGLTGRAMLWGVAIEAIAERPVLGHGPGAWTRVAQGFEPSVDPRRFPHSHSGYLELALTYGAVGVSVVVTFLVSVYLALLRGAARLMSAAARATLLAFAVLNLVDAFVVDGRFLAIVILVAGAAWGAGRPGDAPSADRLA